MGGRRSHRAGGGREREREREEGPREGFGPIMAAAEEPSLAELESKYADDDEGEAGRGDEAAPPLERGGRAEVQERAEDAEGAGALYRDDGDFDDGEDDDFFDEEDDEIKEALDWLDIQEDGGRAAGARMGSYQGSMGRRPNAQGGAANAAASGGSGRGGARQKQLQPMSKQAYKLEGKVNTARLSGKVSTALSKLERQVYVHGQGGGKSKDKADRATVEQALDPRTRMVLFKMLNRGLFNEIFGCVSTGKEANVYHAVGADGNDMAVKVFKTSILVFRDRDRYVTGDWRFRRGYCKSNPRKMVKLWAEKEMRNLIRLASAGIPCPTPIQLRLHVLVMSFIGHDGYAAPRLKDANLSHSKCRQLYRELVVHMRTMYQKCKLVHGDLSEYNMLYHQNNVWIIDVSQSVDLDHPHAFDFLREDCAHVNAFFEKNGTRVIPKRDLFDFITDPALKDEEVDTYLEDLQRRIEEAPEMTDQDRVDEAVFHQAFIPRKMDEIADFERDLRKMRGEAGEAGEDARKVDGIYYQTILGLKQDLSGPRTGALAAAGGAAERSGAGPEDDLNSSSGEGEGSGSDSDGEGSSGEEEEGEWEERKKLTKEEKKKLRRENKVKVKEENKEKRKHKIPKHIKKKKTKSKGRKK